MHLTRTFHTVGQGAFYTEIFDNGSDRAFTVVYDCGSYSLGTKSLDPAKNASLKAKVHGDLGVTGERNPEVDILFISHFDTDHINGCQFLSPKVVIIPFLTDEQINILSAVNIVTDGDMRTDILRNPEAYFSGAKVIRVLPAEEGLENQIDGPYVDLTTKDRDNLLGGMDRMASGQSIYLHDRDRIWEYMPYNPRWDHFFREFRDRIDNDRTLDYAQLDKTDNGAYVISHIKELRKIYDQMGDKNKHSLVVYSGPLSDAYTLRTYIDYDSGIRYRHIFNPLFDRHPYRSACVYYGDISVAKRWHDSYSRLLDATNRTQKTGTVQIPHHGAWSGRGHLCLSPGIDDYLCVISVGEINQYGHPSARILSSILGKDSFPILVTEHPRTLIIEVIHLS